MAAYDNSSLGQLAGGRERENEKYSVEIVNLINLDPVLIITHSWYQRPKSEEEEEEEEKEAYTHSGLGNHHQKEE